MLAGRLPHPLGQLKRNVAMRAAESPEDLQLASMEDLKRAREPES